jgi:hypothetical protein
MESEEWRMLLCKVKYNREELQYYSTSAKESGNFGQLSVRGRDRVII